MSNFNQIELVDRGSGTTSSGGGDLTVKLVCTEVLVSLLVQF